VDAAGVRQLSWLGPLRPAASSDPLTPVAEFAYRDYEFSP
jgi:hypothetical protein